MILLIRSVQRGVVFYISLSIYGKNSVGGSKFSFRTKMSNKLPGFAASFSDLKKGLIYAQNPVWCLSYASQSSNCHSANPARILTLSHYNYYRAATYLPLA